METTTAQHLVTGYLACWNETDPGARAALIEATWAPEARSVDPIADVTGRDAIDAMIAATQAQFPNHRFEQDGEISEHHDVLHWGWRLAAADGSTVVSGFDVATLRDGRIDLLAGFFNK